MTTAQEEQKNATNAINGFLRVRFAQAQVDTLTKQVGYYDEAGNSKKIAMGVLEAAVRVYNETATFAEAGVAGRRNT